MGPWGENVDDPTEKMKYPVPVLPCSLQAESDSRRGCAILV